MADITDIKKIKVDDVLYNISDETLRTEVKIEIDLINEKISDLKTLLESLTDRDWTKDMEGNDTNIWT